MTSLSGKLLVVTGAGRGLGLAIAEAAGNAGARVVVAEIDRGRGERAEKRLTDKDIEAVYVPVDVSDVPSVSALAQRVATMGPVWGLVNNAGLADAVGGKAFWEIDPEEWDRMQAVNARGTWLMSRALAPSMMGEGQGRIIHITSDAALYGSPRLSHYIASKGAVIALTRAMAREVGDHGITVNAIAPGLLVGESSVRIPSDRHELYAAQRAITRPQEPTDVAGAVLFLLSDEGRYVTGHTLVVDGGFVMA